MPGPTLVFGFIVATFVGAGFHLLMGGDARRLAIFLVASWLGFSLGQLVGDIINLGSLIGFADIGSLHFFLALLGSVLASVFSYFVTRDRHNIH